MKSQRIDNFLTQKRQKPAICVNVVKICNGVGQESGLKPAQGKGLLKKEVLKSITSVVKVKPFLFF